LLIDGVTVHIPPSEESSGGGGRLYAIASFIKFPRPCRRCLLWCYPMRPW